MDQLKIKEWKEEMTHHLIKELLPFWQSRILDEVQGGFLTQFDTNGEDAGTDEKSLLAHMRSIYAFSLVHLQGFDPEGRFLSLAREGVHFAVDHYWDSEFGGFYWLFNRNNEILIDQKIVYGHSFAIYALATYTLASGDSLGLDYAQKCFDLIQIYAVETSHGGYWEMFERDWTLCGPGSAGGDRKTLDVHMHLMEALTALYLCSGKDVHKRKLQELIDLIVARIMHPKYGTGIPQFFQDWSVAPQIKFDIIWGWDRFEGEMQEKSNTLDNTSYGHNVEFFWLMADALKALGINPHKYDELFTKILNHALSAGVDFEFGGVYVEGSHDGKEVYDKAKEFWQQAEFLTGMLDAYLLYGDEKYLEAYENIHKFVMKHMIKHEVGEWWPLLTREGTVVWEHMSHSWKVNYHTIRAAVLSVKRLERISAL
ncbi:N-acylglucosamine 2-epimerase [Oceanispirochaeta crateris]|uniref:N-acylglucosamine 2-epimerase n=1 Tax=Oceanispirochaeta crateris TaxID=2518645 RepID=A0A5C1QIX9_9SPIO|nr:AGE family epimerase/isomerase [Oceanispirochaeta crateris]QEN08115.1 N-acylglucosamine 2-epimerase [Oceanispirochaeta crateris]